MQRVLTLVTAVLLLNLWNSVYAVELPDFAKLVRDNREAVVNIRTTKTDDLPNTLHRWGEDSPLDEFFNRFFKDSPKFEPRQREARSLGSGFIISADGYIYTNAHVVKDATNIVVRFHDNREKEAELVGKDDKTDFALLKVDATGLPIVKMGDSDELEVGQWVLAIGSPFGLEHTATQGIISALSRSLPSDTYIPFIQTDVALNPGNSGGPLFNTRGEVIGINSQIYSRTGGYMGLSFAIPINVAQSIAQQLKTQGYASHGWLGVLIQPVDQALAESFGLERPYGALVAEVMPDSPAERAGVREGDIIIEYDGHYVSTSADLPPMVGSTAVDKTVDMLVLRDGKRKNLRVTIAELNSDDSKPTGKHRITKHNTSRLNMVVVNPSKRQKEEHEIDHGVLVSEIRSGAAQTAGIREGDIILQFNREKVHDVSQFNRLVKDTPAGKTVAVLLQRGDRPRYIPLKMP